jgi:hypothetical protein
VRRTSREFVCPFFTLLSLPFFLFEMCDRWASSCFLGVFEIASLYRICIHTHQEYLTDDQLPAVPRAPRVLHFASFVVSRLPLPAHPLRYYNYIIIICRAIVGVLLIPLWLAVAEEVVAVEAAVGCFCCSFFFLLFRTAPHLQPTRPHVARHGGLCCRDSNPSFVDVYIVSPLLIWIYVDKYIITHVITTLVHHLYYTGNLFFNLFVCLFVCLASLLWLLFVVLVRVGLFWRQFHVLNADQADAYLQKKTRPASFFSLLLFTFTCLWCLICTCGSTVAVVPSFIRCRPTSTAPASHQARGGTFIYVTFRVSFLSLPLHLLFIFPAFSSNLPLSLYCCCFSRSLR